MVEIKSKFNQEFADETDDLENTVKAPDKNLTKAIESEKPVESSTESDSELSDEEVLAMVEASVAEQAEGVVQEINESSKTLEEFFDELNKDIDTAESAPLEAELAEAKNELLGVTSDAYEALESKIEDIVSDKSADLKVLREKWGYQKPEVIAGIAKLSAVEASLKKSATDVVKSELLIDTADAKTPEETKLKTEAEPVVEQEPPFVLPDLEAVEPEPLNFDLFAEDTEVAMENPVDNEVKEEIPLRSQKNVGAFKKLSADAKQIFTDLTFKYRGQQEIKKGQKLVERSDDKIHTLNLDISKSEDKIEEFRDKLLNIDELLAKIGSDIKPKEAKAIEKSRKDLELKIKDSEKAKASLADKLKIEEANKAKFELSVAAAMAELEAAISTRIEPYQMAIAKLETNRANLVEEQDNFELVIGEFTGRLENLKDQLAELDSIDMPRAAKKSFKTTLTRKVKAIEAALKVSQKNLASLEDNIIRVNGRLNKEEDKINKWTGIKTDLASAASQKIEKDREVIGRGYSRQVRPLEISDTEAGPAFSPADYLAKWNSFSKADGMTLDVKVVLAKSGDLTPKRLESIIKTTRFKGLSERQLKKKTQEKIDLLRTYFNLH